MSLKYYFTSKEDLCCRIIAASKPLNHISFVLKVIPEMKCPIFTMSVVAMGRTFVLMSHGPSARLNLDFDKTRQCLNLIQSTFLLLKRRLMPKVEFSRSWCAQKQAACPTVCGTPAPHTHSPLLYLHINHIYHVSSHFRGLYCL